MVEKSVKVNITLMLNQVKKQHSQLSSQLELQMLSEFTKLLVFKKGGNLNGLQKVMKLFVVNMLLNRLALKHQVEGTF